MAGYPFAETVAPIINGTRGGISLIMPSTADDVIEASSIWTLAGWELQILSLPPNAEFSVPASTQGFYIKVITGRLTSPDRSPYARPLAIRSTKISSKTVIAGPQGALITLFNETTAARSTLSSMDQIQFDGPLAAALPFDLFHDKFGSFTDAFASADAYMSPGIHLLDGNGQEICNLIFWTAGKGVNLTTHNHGHPPSAAAPAFAEVHWVLRNGTGTGGMFTAPDQQAPAEREYPMQTGEEHGPFFHLDASGKQPLRLANGAVAYPWHGWCGGSDGKPGQAYDLVCAFEIAPEHAKIAL